MKTILFAAVLPLISIVSFVFGAHYGVYQYRLLSSSTEAALIAGELEAMRGPKLELLIRAKEVELDGLLATYAKFVDGGAPWIFWPISRGFDHEKNIRKAVRYRTHHPIATPNQKLRDQAERVIRVYTP